MTTITKAHFGGNVILTRDSLRDGEPFAETLKEIGFSNLRYPGGGITEAQTWANGGLDRMFGPPMERDDPNYVLTIDETLDYAAAHGQSVSIVVPTFQFYNTTTGAFDHQGFDRYLTTLEAKILDHPETTISALEVGNEYWGSKEWGGLSGDAYGAIANAEVPKLHAMVERLSNAIPGWDQPGIGIQAGVQWAAAQNPDGSWTATGPQESRDIIAQIAPEHRAMIDTVLQHSYPEAGSIVQNLNWAVRPMDVFQEAEGFPDDLHYSLSEFNIGGGSALGIDQGAAWVDAFSKAVDHGIDSMEHWGVSYKWLSNKFYDTQFPAGESDGGSIVAIATPMGQIYDIAQSHLIGKSTMDQQDALQSIGIDDGLTATGFADDTQRIVFLHNPSKDTAGTVDLSGLPQDQHLSVRILTPADSPHSPWFDESARELHKEDGIADSRGDMKVVSGRGVQDSYTLQPGEMLVVVASDPHRDLVIEGAHNLTDPSTGMVDDLIIGGLGNDILRGHVGNDTIEGGGGKNVLSGGKGDDTLVASDEGDVIVAQEGNDTVTGGDGDDLIFLGGGDQPSNSTVVGGEGSNLFVIGQGANTVIQDFSARDHLGFGGAFKDGEALRNAARTEGEDAIITMPDGSEVILAGQADSIDGLSDQVLDFMDPEAATAITDTYLQDLTFDQVHEVFARKDDAGEGEQHAYFDTLPATLERLNITQEGGENPGVEEPSVPETPDTPPPPPEDEDDGGHPTPGPQEPDAGNEGEPEEAQDSSSASGGACFVATAAYGDRLHPEVVALRAFRDHHLVNSRAGRAFVRAYWIVGPKMAARTRPNQPHARAIRHALSWMVAGLRKMDLTQGV